MSKNSQADEFNREFRHAKRDLKLEKKSLVLYFRVNLKALSRIMDWKPVVQAVKAHL